MAHTSAGRKSSKKRVKSSTLPLPFELREQILLNLLPSPLISRRNDLPAIWLRPLYPAGNRYQNRFQMGNNQILSRQFDALCLVSQQMRKDAIKILFAHNEIVIEISLMRGWVWQSYPETGTLHRHSLARVSRTISYTTGGEEALLSIRSLDIAIACGHQSGQISVERYLKELVSILKQSKCLQDLAVQRLNCYGVDSFPTFNSRRGFLLEAKSGELERQVNGPRFSTDRMSNNLSIFATDAERILSPLKHLRG